MTYLGWHDDTPKRTPAQRIADPATTDPRFAEWRAARRQSGQDDERSIGRMLGGKK